MSLVVMEAITELRKNVQSSKLVIGLREVRKMLKQDKLSRVFVASNLPEASLLVMRQSCEAVNCELVELAIPNDELGVMCKKPFSIAAVGVLR